MQVTGRNFQLSEEDSSSSESVKGADQLRIGISKKSILMLFLHNGTYKAHFTYTFSKLSSYESLAEILEDLIQEYDFIKDFNSLDLILNNSIFTLVPESIFVPNEADKILNFNSAESDYEVKTQHFPNLNLLVVFGVPTPLINVSNALLKNASWKFRSTHLLQELPKEFNQRELYVHISDQNLYLYAFENSSLCFYNDFNFENEEELAYYVLFTMEQLHFNPEEVPLYILGCDSTKDKNFEILYQYNRHTHLYHNESIYRMKEPSKDFLYLQYQ